MEHDAQPVGHKVTMWLADPLPLSVSERIERMAAAQDVVKVAVMPDAHLSAEYCVGTAVATRARIFPHAVGGDIGCGMTAIRVDCDAAQIVCGRPARQLLRMLNRFVPSNRHSKATAVEQLPGELCQVELSDPRLEKLKKRDGRVQLGTLGRGNHFLEFQADQEGSLWMMLHSGSRAMGQAITRHHLQLAHKDASLPYFVDTSEAGRNYLHDVGWARAYARHNRLAMLWMTAELLKTLWKVDLDEHSLLESDHNHVRQEPHAGETLWIHRKGAQSAAAGELGVIPGSMGTTSYHVEGRGCEQALCSSAHGAGRRHSRSEARSKFSAKEVRRQMGAVLFDERKLQLIRDEAPAAYKDIRRVMKAQRELVKTVRELRPLLSYKGV